MTIQIHHITPKCLLRHKSKEFINHPSNLIKLEYKYHQSVHKWLFMLTGDIGCEQAYNAMMTGKFSFSEGKHTSATKNKIKNASKKLWENDDFKKSQSVKKLGDRNHFFNKRHTEKTKKELSELSIIRFKDPNERQKISIATKEIMNTPEIKLKISKDSIEKWKSPEIRIKMTESIKLAMQDETLRKYLSQKAKERVKITCIHCNKIVDASNFHRWHGDNCKFK